MPAESAARAEVAGGVTAGGVTAGVGGPTRGGWPRAAPFAALAGLVVVAVMAVVGVSSGSGPESDALGRTDTVVVVSIPGLRWQDLVATDTPVLDALLGDAATLSVRTVGPTTSTLEGYLTIGAGNRLSDRSDGDGDSTGDGTANEDALAVVDGRCVPAVLGGAADSADEELSGAEAGALGERLSDEGIATSVFGPPDAIAALMDASGCVGRYETGVPTGVEPGVTLVELAGLGASDLAAERLAALQAIEADLAAIEVPSSALVIVLAPSAPHGRAEVVVVGVRRPFGTAAGGSADGSAGASTGGSLVSATTRRADYVTLPDIAPAVLAAIAAPGRELPESMSGTEMRSTTAETTDAAAHQAALADLAERVEFRDRTVGPVSVLFVVLLTLCGVAALAHRHRLARMLAPIVMAYPSVAFTTGLVAYHQLPLTFVIVMTFVVSVVVASTAVSAAARLGRWAPVGALAVVLWALLVVDVCTGGRLQINTPLGYTPTVAGRFQGFGNLSFGLVGAASICVVAAAMHLLADRAVAPARRPTAPAVLVATFVGVVTTLAVALPAFGSDVGGTLAIVPTFAIVVPLVAGRRIGWRPVALTAIAAVVVVGGLAAADLARPASSRTHLGRFLDDLLHGDGGLVIRRKLRSNLGILTSSFWSFVLIGVVVVAVVAARRRRDVVVPLIEHHPPLRVFLVGFGVVALLGFGLNDSGIAVPAIMLGVAVPWLVASLVPVVRRAGR